MPKQLYKITQFHGGLNSNSDARDIAESELSEATDVMVDELGKIRMMGGTTAHTSSNITPRANQINPGYGLFQFSHDREGGEDAGSSEDETGADYLAFSEPDTGGSDSGVHIYSDKDNAWGIPIDGIANNDAGLRKDVFYTVDGALRVCDSDFGNSNSNKWYGYIYRTHFSGLTPGGSADDYNAWYLKSAELAAPPICLASKLEGTADASGSATILQTGSDDMLRTGTEAEMDAIIDGNLILDRGDGEQLTLANDAFIDHGALTTPGRDAGDWDSIDWALFPKPGEGFHLNVVAGTGSGGSIPAGNYELAISYLYDAEPGESTAQESLPIRCEGGGPDSQYFAIAAGEWTIIEVFATSPYDPRITGGRVYWRIIGSGDWIHVLDISLKNGVRKGLFGPTSSWSVYDDASTVCLSSSSGIIYSTPTITWSDINSMSQDATTMTAKYKTAVVTNRMAYVGHVQYDGTIYGDAVFKSPVNKFDVFSSDRRLEANINDGDSIVKLETYADRLLIFKKNKLELLNISQEVEFVEDTFMHKGVSHPAATCKTDFGVAWVNRQGCYLYDGQKITNLLEKQGRQIIKESDWDSFTTDNSIIGYVPKKRQIIVLKNCAASGGGDIYLFDMVTQSWVKGTSKFTGSQAQTNFVTDWNGDLVHAHTSETGTIEKWDDAVDSSIKLNMQTKDIDFGEPGRLKTIYKVYLTFRGDGSDVQVNWGYNGAAVTGTFFPISSGTDGSSTGSGATNKCIDYDAGTNDWLKAELVPGSAVTDINSFRLKISADDSNAIAADFEINDITIVYRLKGLR